MVVQHRQVSKHANADALSRTEGGNPCLDFRLLVNLDGRVTIRTKNLGTRTPP